MTLGHLSILTSPNANTRGNSAAAALLVVHQAPRFRENGYRMTGGYSAAALNQVRLICRNYVCLVAKWLGHNEPGASPNCKTAKLRVNASGLVQQLYY